MPKRPWNFGKTKETDTRLASVSKHMSLVRKARHGSWKTIKGLHIPRDPDAAKRAGETFRKRYALGLIRRAAPKYERTPYKRRDGALCYLRKSYELTFARMLDDMKLDWFYEPKRFSLSDGHVYTPDFLVFFPDWMRGIFPQPFEFIEVKGWFKDVDKRKLALFKCNYPHVPFRLVDGEAMKLLQAMEKQRNGERLQPREERNLAAFEASAAKYIADIK